jgi:polyisoprenoid-binding protein YceI
MIPVWAPVSQAETLTYVFTPQSTLTYFVTHPFHHVKGVSHAITGHLRLNFKPGQLPQLAIPAFIEAPIASFESENANRDVNMQTIMNAAVYPEALLTVRELHWDIGDSRTLKGTALGELSLHGQSRPVSIALMGDANGQRLKVQGNFSFLLSAYGIERPSLLFLPIDDRVTLALDATALPLR